jgi:hypothetical protein
MKRNPLEVYVNNKLLKKFMINRAGAHVLSIQLKDMALSPIEVTIRCNTSMSSEYATRAMAIFMLKMELIK